MGRHLQGWGEPSGPRTIRAERLSKPTLRWLAMAHRWAPWAGALNAL